MIPEPVAAAQAEQPSRVAEALVLVRVGEPELVVRLLLAARLVAVAVLWPVAAAEVVLLPLAPQQLLPVLAAVARFSPISSPHSQITRARQGRIETASLWTTTCS